MRPSTVALFVTTAMRIEGLCSRKLRAAFAASFRKWLSVFCPPYAKKRRPAPSRHSVFASYATADSQTSGASEATAGGSGRRMQRNGRAAFARLAARVEWLTSSTTTSASAAMPRTLAEAARHGGGGERDRRDVGQPVSRRTSRASSAAALLAADDIGCAQARPRALRCVRPPLTPLSARETSTSTLTNFDSISVATGAPTPMSALRHHFQSFLVGGVTALSFGYYVVHQDVWKASGASRTGSRRSAARR